MRGPGLLLTAPVLLVTLYSPECVEQGLQDSTIATWLHDAGYQTGLFGKYLNDYTDLGIPPGWDRWYAWNGVSEGWSALNDQGTQKTLIRRAADRGVSNAALKFLGDRLGGPVPVFASVNFGAEHSPYYYDDQVDDDAFEGWAFPAPPPSTRTTSQTNRTT